MKFQVNEGHAGVLTMRDDTTKNYGVIRVTKDGRHLVHYTGKGLREIYPHSPNEEERKKAEELKAMDEKDLIHSGHIEWTLVVDILDAS
ncbi:MAG: hypothetical protein K9J17_09700 [Flavobacteriales bacterium]|nr:hypothetical protein [Flavobacteriales bacterium]